MDEIRRFIRYTLPGIVCSIEFFIAIAISDAPLMKNIIDNLGSKSNIALVLGGLLATGGLGYIFSSVYFTILLTNPFYKLFSGDHKTVLTNSAELIEILDSTNKPVSPDSLTRRESWEVLTQFWHSEKEKSDELKGINPYIDRVVDITHGLGATSVGSIITFITWIFLHYQLMERTTIVSSVDIGVIILWLLLIMIFVRNYKSTQKSIQALINSTIRKVLQSKFEADKSKIVIYYVK